MPINCHLSRCFKWHALLVESGRRALQCAASFAPSLRDAAVDTNMASYLASQERTTTQVKDLRDRLDRVREGGGLAAVNRHLARSKALPRDRIHALVDPGTPVLELSPLAGCLEDIPSGGIVTAIGIVSGTPCMLVANDATVKGGTYFPITAKKHLRAQEIALASVFWR